jgi:hypothetical protein
MSHAQFSNGLQTPGRGDLMPEVSLEQAAAAVGNTILQFIVANSRAGGADDEECVAAESALEAATSNAAKQLAPYAKGLGRPSPEAALEGHVEALCLARGAEALFQSSPSATFLAHPGELRAAELFAEGAQRRALLRAFSEETASGIALKAIAHLSVDTFLYSQTDIMKCENSASGWGILLHVLLHRPALGSHVPTAAVSPLYAMKLKSAARVAAVIGQSTSQQCAEDLTGSMLAHATFEEALALLPPTTRERYARRGTFLRCVDLNEGRKPWNWCPEVPQVEWNSSAEATLCLPEAKTALMSASGEDPSRFVGALYLKCPSLAWMMEWIAVMGLREPQGF